MKIVACGFVSRIMAPRELGNINPNAVTHSIFPLPIREMNGKEVKVNNIESSLPCFCCSSIQQMTTVRLALITKLIFSEKKLKGKRKNVIQGGLRNDWMAYGSPMFFETG
ncbi:MAG: hypothetical protein JW757_12525 [Anaerolineales bacterium]|nr:hypothetical protein [Anaerolineales bacterium]